MFLRYRAAVFLLYVFSVVFPFQLQAETVSIAEQELQRIVKQQESLFQDIQVHQDGADQVDFERRMHDLLLSYELFITENPGNVYAYILYGKVLLKVDDEGRAYEAFMKADQLDPNLAVVKQQLGNFLAERGEYAAALAHFLMAIDLEPEMPIYHYQLGELLYAYRNIFIKKKVFDPAFLDKQMLEAFKRAAELAPHERDLKMRFAEAYYDVDSPDWGHALDLWNELLQTASCQKEEEVIRMHKARILMELHRPEEARAELNKIYSPSLEGQRRELLNYLIAVLA